VEQVEASARTLRQSFGALPKLGVILGSGFQSLLQSLPVENRIAWNELPGFPISTVKGHRPEIVLGRLGPQPALIICGRVHLYESCSMEQVTFPVRFLAAAGIRDLVLTNAAGGINRRYRAGEFMLVKDHINFMGMNPLAGASANNRFLDLTEVYDAKLNALFLEAAAAGQIKLHHGVYIGVTGPTYETPAEIRAFRKWGADAVGMSTVPEAIVARHCGLSVAALSCITNAAAGVTGTPLSHDEVLTVARENATAGLNLLKAFASRYYDRSSGENELRNSSEQLPSTLPK
jgi:purine-nucleoside phosphorylase